MKTQINSTSQSNAVNSSRTRSTGSPQEQRNRDVPQAEFLNHVRTLGGSPGEARDLFKSIDRDNSNSLTQTELYKVEAASKHLSAIDHSEIQNFIKSSDGITLENFLEYAQSKGIGSTEAEDLFSLIDRNGSGGVRESEFDDRHTLLNKWGAATSYFLEADNTNIDAQPPHSHVTISMPLTDPAVSDGLLEQNSADSEGFTDVRPANSAYQNTGVLDGDTEYVRTESGGTDVASIAAHTWSNGLVKSWHDDYNHWNWPLVNHDAVDGKIISENNIMNSQSPGFWDNYVDEILLAQPDAVLFHNRGPVSGNMPASNMKHFMAAIERAGSGARDIVKVGLFDDTGALNGNLEQLGLGSQLDPENPEHQEYWYNEIYKAFYSEIPRDMWYTTDDGRPIMVTWNATSTDFTNSSKLNELISYAGSQFEKDFGVKPFWVLQKNWFEQSPELENSEYVGGRQSWFSKVSGKSYSIDEFKGFTTGLLVPGHTNSMIDFNASGEMYNIPREQSDGSNTFENGFQAGLSQNANLMIHEGWNNAIENGGIYRSPNWDQPTQYINIMRRFANPNVQSLRFQAEGADEVFDNTAGNKFGGYAPRDVDVQRHEVLDANGKLAESGWYVADTEPGEWLEYKNVELGEGTYRFTGNVATNQDGLKLEFGIPGTENYSEIELPNTHGELQLVHFGAFDLANGSYNFRTKMLSSGINLDWFHMRKVETDNPNAPYLGT